MTSPVTLNPGDPVTGASLDAYEALTGPWNAYSPVWSQSGSAPTLNNGTLTGAYMQVGKLVAVRIVLTIGSSTAFGSGAFSLSLPVAPQIDSGLESICLDSSASTRYSANVHLYNGNANGDNMRTGGNSTGGNIAPTVPFAWATGDKWVVWGMYEAS